MATTRFEARVETDVLAVIRRAAEIQGRTMSDFVVSAARSRATRHFRRGSDSPVGGGFGALRLGDSVASPADGRIAACTRSSRPTTA